MGQGGDPNLATGVLAGNPVGDPTALLRRFDAQAYHPNATAIPFDTVADLRTEGFDVNIWAINDKITMRILIKARINNLFTDFLQRLKTLLAEA